MMTWLTETQRPVRRDNSGLAHSNIQTGEYGGDLDCQHSKGPMSHSSLLCHNTDASIHLSFHPFTKPANTATSSQWFNSTSEQICLSICQLVCIQLCIYLSICPSIHGFHANLGFKILAIFGAVQINQRVQNVYFKTGMNHLHISKKQLQFQYKSIR